MHFPVTDYNVRNDSKLKNYILRLRGWWPQEELFAKVSDDSNLINRTDAADAKR